MLDQPSSRGTELQKNTTMLERLIFLYCVFGADKQPALSQPVSVTKDAVAAQCCKKTIYDATTLKNRTNMS